MNIMENKRVAAVSLVMALAFGGICYYGYGRYTDLKATQTRISEISNKLEDYSAESNPPNAKNRDLVTQAAKDAKELRDKLYADLLQYASFCMAGQGAQVATGEPSAPAPKGANAYMPVSNPNAFQHNFTALMGALGSYAAEKGCTLDPSVARFGNYSEFEKNTAKEEDVPYLNFLLYAANNAVREIIDSGAPSIKKLYFRELPGAAERKDKIVRLSFEVAFAAKRSQLIDPAKQETLSVLPQVINKLTHDKRFFYIPTGLAVNTRENLPAITPEVFAVSAAAEDDEEVSAAADGQTAPLALPHVGKGDETVDIYLTLQVLYFTSDKF